MSLKGKKICLGVTGAISAYKALELTRLLVKEGALVSPVMTASAAKFVTPLSLSTLAKSPVYTDLFELTAGSKIGHIELAQGSDLICVAPATASVMGKVASGIADDLLTTIVMAASCPVLFAPSMNTQMWNNSIVVANVAALKAAGYLFVGPSEGELACGTTGKGRLAPVEDVLEGIVDTLSVKDLAGEKVLVTAGPTREQIDPVRFVSNSSSGRMGYAIARAAKRRGAEVVLISGPTHLPCPSGVTTVPAVTAQELSDACAGYFPQSTIVIMSAAVADYRPVKTFAHKVKKDGGPLTIEMERTADVLSQMGKKKKGQFLVGFALETEKMEENAKKKLREKNLDIVVANTPAGLDSETNQVTIIDRTGASEPLAPMKKDVLADMILDRVVRLKRG